MERQLEQPKGFSTMPKQEVEVLYLGRSWALLYLDVLLDSMYAQLYLTDDSCWKMGRFFDFNKQFGDPCKKNTSQESTKIASPT